MSARGHRQRKVHEWARRAFGDEQATSVEQLGIRLLEEAVEAYQAADGDRSMAHKLVDFVFDRPKGELAQELGGVGVTLLALAAAGGLSADDEEVREVARVLSKPESYYAARNQKKNDAGFVAPRVKP